MTTITKADWLGIQQKLANEIAAREQVEAANAAAKVREVELKDQLSALVSELQIAKTKLQQNQRVPASASAKEVNKLKKAIEQEKQRRHRAEESLRAAVKTLKEVQKAEKKAATLVSRGEKQLEKAKTNVEKLKTKIAEEKIKTGQAKENYRRLRNSYAKLRDESERQE